MSSFRFLLHPVKFLDSHSPFTGVDRALRLSIDSRTVLIAQENDPTQLRSPSPGKLVRYFIESGEHISKGQAYAEIEVMKVSFLFCIFL